MKISPLNIFNEISSTNVPKADFHMHTEWTDGKHSVEAMYESAVQKGLKAILFTEHARKTSGDWFPKFASEVRKLPKSPCEAFVGVETKIESFDGDIDCDEAILNECDLVMASVHRFPGEKGVVRGFGDVDPATAVDLEFKLACSVLKNPRVHILGHPFGMSYRRYNQIVPDEKIKTLIREVAKSGKRFEINIHYHPEPWKWIDWCLELGAHMTLGSNAHDVDEVARVVTSLEKAKANV